MGIVGLNNTFRNRNRLLIERKPGEKKIDKSFAPCFKR